MAKEDWFASEENENLGKEFMSIDCEHNGVTDDNGKVFLLGHDLNSLSLLVRFMRRVLCSDDVPFQIVLDKRGRKQVTKASSLAEDFHLLHAMTKAYSRDYTYHPMLALFWKVFQHHRVRLCVLKQTNLAFGDGSLEVEIFNDFVSTLRKEGARMNVAKKASDWENATDDNVTRTKRYIDALFEQYESLAVIDLCLYDKAFCVDPTHLNVVEDKVKRQAAYDLSFIYGEPVEEQDLMETQRRFNVTELVADRKRLLSNMRNKPSLFGNLVGYVWRVEWSRICGHYLRVAFFFDSSTVTDVVALGDQIGNYWCEQITRGRGAFRSSNRLRSQIADQLGIGHVARNDMAKREKLKNTFCYRAKRNRYVFVQPVPRSNLFGTSHMPGVKPVAGRLRKSTAG